MRKRIFSAAALLLCCAALCICPGFARTICQDAWSAEILPAGGAEDDLIFVEGGQTVILNQDEHKIPINFAFDGEAEVLSDGFLYDVAQNELTLHAEHAAATATVSLRRGETILSATFTAQEQLSLAGTVTAPAYYDKAYPVQIVSDGAATIGDFPAYTRYTVDGRTTLLYSGGQITLAANTVCLLDLSRTALEADLSFATADGTVQVKRVTLPTDTGGMLIDGEVELPIDFTYEGLAPTFTVTRLTLRGDELVFVDDARVLCLKSENGKILIAPGDAAPGTYKITISWLAGQALEKIFYIQSVG